MTPTVRRRTALLAFLACLALPVWALSDPPEGELKARRARLAQWRQHPEQIARLRRDYQAFSQLPPERRQQIERLDRELHEEPPAVQARLWGVLGRYDEWLERLPEKDRQAVREAPTTQDRLAVIKRLRDEEWMRSQPRAVQQEWAGLQGPQRDALVQKLRQEERQRRQEWHVAARFWRELEGRQPLPARLADFDYRFDKELTGGVQVLFNEYLLPRLSEAEKERLKNAEGKWPDYAVALVETTDRHPFALPGPDGPRAVQQLPQAVQGKMRNPKSKEAPKVLKAAEGKWPDFAVAVTQFAQKVDRHLPNELWPYNYQCLLTPMREFVEKSLRPVLTNDEKLTLSHAEGQWPRYPETIQALARAHNLHPPWQTALPGPRERWDGYRALKLAGN